jgi:hypothetical protein
VSNKVAHNDRDLRSTVNVASLGANPVGFAEKMRKFKVRGNLSGISLNPFVPRSGFHKRLRPINLRVNPDRSDAISPAEKYRELRNETKGFFLVKGIASERTGIAAGVEIIACPARNCCPIKI